MTDNPELSPSLKPAVRQLQAVLEKLKAKPDASITQATAARPPFSPTTSRSSLLRTLPLSLRTSSSPSCCLRTTSTGRGLHRQGNYITADMPQLRKALAILVDESRPIRSRLDQLIAKSSPMVPHLGRAVLTGILLVCHPEQYGVWNSTSEAGLKKLEVWPQFERGASFGERYLAVNQVLQSLSKTVGVDLWTLDTLYWQLLRSKSDGEGDEEETTGTPPDLLRFGLERYLHDFLRDNWDRIADFQGWSLYEEDGEQVGYEYITPIGRIDLLAKHKTKPDWLVVELKRYQSSDDTLGQTLRYMGWVSDKLAQPGDEVHGLIVSSISDERLHYALKYARNVELMLYEVDFHLKKP